MAAKYQQSEDNRATGWRESEKIARKYNEMANM